LSKEYGDQSDFILATIGTTLLAGVMRLQSFSDPRPFKRIPFSVTLWRSWEYTSLAIFFLARKHQVAATLPFSYRATFIRRSEPSSKSFSGEKRRALLEIGAAVDLRFWALRPFFRTSPDQTSFL
jgi:hypothetical protein